MNSEFVDYIVGDVLGFLDNLSVKRLFDGYGIYRNGKIFAMTHDDMLYLKLIDSQKKLIKNLEGSTQFTYFRNNKEIGLPYWSVPEDVLENSDMMMELIESINS